MGGLQGISADLRVSGAQLIKPYYEQSGVTIYHGDCRDVIRVLPHDGSVGCVVTSPPYNHLASMTRSKPSGLWGKTSGGKGFMDGWKGRGYADDMPEKEYQGFQNQFFGGLRRAGICGDDASLFYNHQLRWRDGACLHPVVWFHPRGWKLRQEIVWNRGGGMMFNAKMFVRFDERIIWFHAGRAKWNQEAVGFGTIWNIAREQQQQGKQHPVGFPEEIPLRWLAGHDDSGRLSA